MTEAFGLYASGELRKVPAALNICEHETLPSDSGTVGETLEGVGFSRTKEKMGQTNATRATSSGVLFSFLLY